MHEEQVPLSGELRGRGAVQAISACRHNGQVRRSCSREFYDGRVPSWSAGGGVGFWHEAAARCR
jgi:hypothetical protein